MSLAQSLAIRHGEHGDARARIDGGHDKALQRVLEPRVHLWGHLNEQLLTLPREVVLVAGAHRVRQAAQGASAQPVVLADAQLLATANHMRGACHKERIEP